MTIAGAVAAAVKAKEVLHASEGDYDDEGMLSMAFGEIVGLLASEDGYGWRAEQNDDQWEGPWIEPLFHPTIAPKGVQETATVTNLLAQCAEAFLTVKPVQFLPQENLFGITADAIQDMGQDAWADRVRDFPRRYWVYHEWKARRYACLDNLENCTAFDAIEWRFTKGWRKRYRDVPRLGSISN